MQFAEMGLGNCEKGGRYCRGPGAAKGPRWSPGALPPPPPQAEAFLEKKITENAILEVENNKFRNLIACFEFGP